MATQIRTFSISRLTIGAAGNFHDQGDRGDDSRGASCRDIGACL